MRTNHRRGFTERRRRNARHMGTWRAEMKRDSHRRVRHGEGAAIDHNDPRLGVREARGRNWSYD